MKKALLLLLLVFCVSTTAYADAGSPWNAGTTWGDKAGQKAIYGLKNVLLGWTELFEEAVQHHQEKRSPLAIGQGLGNAVMDTIGGALHFITAPLTGVDVPLPEGGVDWV